MKIQISSAPSEIGASIIKGYLEGAGIPATIAPDNNNFSLSLHVSKGPNVTYAIFVEEEKAEEAQKICAELFSKEEFNTNSRKRIEGVVKDVEEDKDLSPRFSSAEEAVKYLKK
jgi:hypothetical protein